jgi:glucose/arabinose dehydrogenase
MSRPCGPLPVGLVALLAACASYAPAQESTLRLPPGFRIETFAPGLGAPRFLAVSPAGDLFVSVPSRGQVLALPDRDRRRAAILQFNADGSGGRTFARGIRNAVGMAFRPQTQELWATNNGRD